MTKRDMSMARPTIGANFWRSPRPTEASGRSLSKHHDGAKHVVDTMKEIVKINWYETCRSVGVSEKDCNRIAGAFAYPGFDLEQVTPVDGR
jgi:serine/threonine-protein kinase HipA